MLTLTRKIGETIRIGDDIEIVVKEIRRNQIRIGIDAPRDINILRGELVEHPLHADQEAEDAEDEDLDFEPCQKIS